MESKATRNTLSAVRTAICTAAGVLMLMIPLVLATPSRAWGYTDPGTGTFLYQAAYAAFLGGTYYLRRLLSRLWRKRK